MYSFECHLLTLLVDVPISREAIEERRLSVGKFWAKIFFEDFGGFVGDVGEVEGGCLAGFVGGAVLESEQSGA